MCEVKLVEGRKIPGGPNVPGARPFVPKLKIYECVCVFNALPAAESSGTSFSSGIVQEVDRALGPKCVKDRGNKNIVDES